MLHTQEKVVQSANTKTALFVVKSEQESYDGDVDNKITMGCQFSSISSVSQLSVIWRRIDPPPTLEVYYLDMGQEKSNGISEHFHSRVRLLKEELKNFRAVIELSQLRLNDSGVYRCIVIQKEADYKQTKLNVRAPYKAIKKRISRLSENKVELSCESQGFPLARVTWSDGMFIDSYLTNRSETSHTRNSDGIFVVNSRVSVTDNGNNYTCSYVTDDGQPSQMGTFVIPDEISKKNNMTKGYAAVAVIVLLCVGLVVGLLILCRRKKELTHLKISSATCESNGQDLNMTTTDLRMRTAGCLRALQRMCKHSAQAQLGSGRGDADQGLEQQQQRQKKQKRCENTGLAENIRNIVCVSESLSFNAVFTQSEMSGLLACERQNLVRCVCDAMRSGKFGEKTKCFDSRSDSFVHLRWTPSSKQVSHDIASVEHKGNYSAPPPPERQPHLRHRNGSRTSATGTAAAPPPPERQPHLRHRNGSRNGSRTSSTGTAAGTAAAPPPLQIAFCTTAAATPPSLEPEALDEFKTQPVSVALEAILKAIERFP
ncbi:Programmed cell death 1 ligand 1 [Bagarius yarrelli]|uniref:Programmed cell death 1 ligand 1 n=1 Tax=Bagarius yarrelli TaxID=175774 RepID=A0A556TUK6_BAGYA|nr:Programmed cell death 1 ligand 1 [Bagarius yarrelli]